MKQKRIFLLLAVLTVIPAALSYSAPSDAQRVDVLGPEVRKYLRVSTPRVVLQHVQVIDGTGAAPMADRNVSIEGGTSTGSS